jgi:hypothetical protein
LVVVDEGFGEVEAAFEASELVRLDLLNSQPEIARGVSSRSPSSADAWRR